MHQETGSRPESVYYAVIAIGEDRPGIVAALTAPLDRLNGNIADSRMSQLGGHFAVLLLVSFPHHIDLAELQAELDKSGRAMDLDISVRRLGQEPHVAMTTADRRYTLVVYGADHPGIVHHITAALAERSVNIADLVTRVLGPADRSVYAMVMDLTLPSALDPEELRHQLSELAVDLAVDITLRPVDQDVL